jgi:hypothetical protein
MEIVVLHTGHGVISSKINAMEVVIFTSSDLERSLCWKNKICFDLQNFIFAENQEGKNMYWTLELASYLEDAPWPATKDELIDYSIRSGAPLEVVENLQELEDDGQPYESIEEIWPDYPTKEDFFFNEDEY